MKKEKLKNGKGNKMKVAVLFTGGKDSCLALFYAKKLGYRVECLITLVSENPYSYMFHTPSISQVKKQAEVLGISLIAEKTKGRKEKELRDLEKAIKKAKEKYGIEGIVTGAVESVYQASRIQKICNNLELECFNPLWLKNQIELLKELVRRKFEVILTGVFAEPLDEKWLGRKIDRKFINEVKKLQGKYKINPAGEGGEFETLVLNMPFFKKKLKVVKREIFEDDGAWRMEVELR